MRLKNICKIVAATLPLCALGGLSGCSDAWDDHYGQVGESSTSSLLECVQDNPEQLSDFLSLLKNTHVYNNHHATSVTFADMLAADQTLTVWAPVNGTFNADSLLELCKTAKGDSTVGQHFVMNHIAHSLYNMNAQTNEDVLMLNNKYLPLNATNLYDAAVIADKANIPATNGLLHIVDNDVQYTYNIYEALTSMQEFAHFGSFLSHYEKQELDEERSIQAGIVDGQKVYSDSVMVKENALFRVFDQIMSEDSAFLMLAPDATVWQQVYDEAADYFNYGSLPKADSISEYWTTVSLMSDLIYNRNIQHVEDSLFSTSFNVREWPYHVYYKPLASDGILAPTNIKDSLLCSNGYIYRLNQWPFTPEELYFHPIITQGEREASIISYKDCTMNYRAVLADTVSGNGYLDIVPRTSTSNWNATFEINNTLSGTYDICAVILPKTVYNANSRDFKPNKFTAVLNYVDAAGNKQEEVYPTELTNDAHVVDTVVIGRFTFPTCNYKQPDATVSLQLLCSISSRQTTFSREMYLDCIYLKPVPATTAGIKPRKEARK
ncbi:MAG: fasciclin domain-containing protein [Bacteroidaceae bacterium]|nr:fasciclin domain-containing protein [Bacteroidaceae bacterium]